MYTVCRCCCHVLLQFQQQVQALQAAVAAAEQLQHDLRQHVAQVKQHNKELQAQMAEHAQQSKAALDEAHKAQEGLEQRLQEATTKHAQAAQQYTCVSASSCFLAPCAPCCAMLCCTVEGDAWPC